MPQASLTGTNLTVLRHHFRTSEGMSVADIDQIVSDASDVFASCLSAGTSGITKGLIYGNIQSGKTAVILALMAIAADNGYRRFVVLTSDLNDLYDQTLDRVKNALHGMTVLDKNDIRQTASAQTPSACALIVSKNVRVLQRAGAVLSTPGWSGQSVLVIDDEADQASLDTAVNVPTSGPSGVNREISRLRASCTSLAFVQTTATPQALLLQDQSAPFRPDFVHVTTPGVAYCGGDIFFVNENFARPRYLRFVPLVDLRQMRANQALPDSIETAIFEFVVAAAMLRLQGSTKNYQALLHTSLKQNEHAFLTPLVNALVRDITMQTTLASSQPMNSARRRILDGLQRAYRANRMVVTGRAMPTFADVLAEVATAIPSTDVVQINSSTGQGVQANPNRRHIIYIGGAKLGRGVTIKNLLVTYYARDARSPQIDTVLQHARMYGYRQRELPLTRIFLPLHLAERFRAIHVSDNSMRDLARTTKKVIPVIPIPISNLNATRRNVLRRQSVELTTYIGGRQYYPLLPISNGGPLQAQTTQLDTALGRLCPVERQMYTVPIADLTTLLNHAYATPGGPGTWDDELVRQAVGLLASQRNYSQGQLVVGTRSSSVSKLATRAGSGGVPQIQALLPANAGNPPYGTRSDLPVLVFMKLTGLRANNWDGIAFWVPNIRFPDGNYAFALNRT